MGKDGRMKLLIANRGEIAIRIARAAREQGWVPVTVYSEDDSAARHREYGDESVALSGRGPRSYLDIEALIAAAQRAACPFLHPGYGFLSENARLASACEAAGIRFVGPSAQVLEQLGDKSRARSAAVKAGVPVPKGLEGPVTLEEARAFLDSLGSDGAVMVKAVFGGGGRGTRAAASTEELDRAFADCRAEARAAFGSDDLYVEEFIRAARHIEVQVVADQHGDIRHVFDRECTLQRKRQKLIEIAPSPSLDDTARDAICHAAIDLAREVRLTGVATMEFLVRGQPGRQSFAFIEANPRIQVEHTVTEEIADVDLVRTQLDIAQGIPLGDCQGLSRQREAPLGFAIQCRINAETAYADGRVAPAHGCVSRFEPPTGPGVRVETSCHQGFVPQPAFDTLIAKIIVHERSGSFQNALERSARALDDLVIEGCSTNIAFLRALLARAEVRTNSVNINSIDDTMATLVEEAGAHGGPLSPSAPDFPSEVLSERPMAPGLIAIRSQSAGLVAETLVKEGDAVKAGTALLLVEAMKMQYPLPAPVSGIVRQVMTGAGDSVAAGQALVVLEEGGGDHAEAESGAERDLDFIRPDLAEVHERHFGLSDSARPAAFAKRRSQGGRTARENIADLCDPDSFIEYGGLTIAAQRGRRSHADLLEASPADGLIAGFGTINGGLNLKGDRRCAILAYDYTVMAGTQGAINHKKTDRLVALADRAKLPVVIFAEGGGGRPGDTDIRLGLDVTTFRHFARLKRNAPLISVVSGYCFAGNAALAGCADVLIATKSASIGMGGPAMIEGGGLGRVLPQQIGPVDVQVANGVIDVVADDEANAVYRAKKVLSYFQGPRTAFEHADQRLLRHLVPENRKHVFSVFDVITTLCDEDSVEELKGGFGTAILTALVRIGGHPLGLIANNNRVLSGAIDAEACSKAADFLTLCERRGLPVLSLCDTPGFMVGPEVERRGQVREACRLFQAGAGLTVPFFAVVLRKAYGLGAQAMVGGHFHAPFFAVSWPTGEFGGMGLEGAVQLGFRRELEAFTDEAAKSAFFYDKLTEYYESGKALTTAEYMEIDDVIDPADTRDWILRGINNSIRTIR